MHSELHSHIKNNHWRVTPLKKVPTYRRYLPTVWAMKHKHNPLGEIITWKACLYADGHKSAELFDY